MADKTKERFGITEEIINTEIYGKGKYKELIPDKVSEEEFKVYILKDFDFELAKKRNRSFKDFCEKWMK